MDMYDNWERMEPYLFYTSYAVKGNRSIDVPKRAYFKFVFDEMLMLDHPSISLRICNDVSKAHAVVNSHSLKQAEENIRTGLDHSRPRIPRSNGHPYAGDPIFMERAFVYAENVAKVIDAVEFGRHIHDFSSVDDFRVYVEDMWWRMMMLRMQAWHMGVKLINREGVTVPHQYYDDPSRIYIL